MDYIEDRLSYNGVGILLFPNNATKEAISQAKRWLHDNLDVIELRVATEEDRDQYYRGRIYAKARNLRWHEINADDLKVIRKERKAGTSIEKFIEVHVLPNVEATKLRNLERFGESIYQL